MKQILLSASILCALLASAMLTACDTNDDFINQEPPGGMTPDIPGAADGDVPAFSTTILPYQGQLATDADKDIVGTDADIFWEVNSFKNKVTITYSGNNASVETDNPDILYKISGAHVVIDMMSNSVSGVEINLNGESDNGSLKIYGEKKLLLNLNGVNLTSRIGPAINSQCKKRMFVNLKDGTVNRLTDAAEYSDDHYYLNGANPGDEDRKGCLFSEGNLIFSGHGSLIVAGKQKHGIASDGYMYLRPATTIAVTEAAKNAIHIKGDKSDDIGIIIAGGEISVKSTGTGGKGLNAGGNLSMTGGETTVVTTGGKYVYNAALDLDSSPKGIKIEATSRLTMARSISWLPERATARKAWKASPN